MQEPLSFTFEPVAIYRSAAKYPYEAPRQGVYAKLPGTVEFPDEPRYHTALADLEGFDRIWLIFVFDQAMRKDWNPLVAPPLTAGKPHYGVFSTRSPHRPNPIGMSCVKLLEIKGNILTVSESDLLSGTPILDVKPYIPAVDSFPDAAAGWRDHVDETPWNVIYSDDARKAMSFIRQLSGLDLENFCHVQLCFDPLNRKRKRLSQQGNDLFLHCRTWKIKIVPDEENRTIYVKNVFSNYSHSDLEPDAPDPHGDKEYHRIFQSGAEQ